MIFNYRSEIFCITLAKETNFIILFAFKFLYKLLLSYALSLKKEIDVEVIRYHDIHKIIQVKKF